MSEQRRIELVCFDLGGVLVQLVSGWHEACERAGVPVHEPYATDQCLRILSDASENI